MEAQLKQLNKVLLQRLSDANKRISALEAKLGSGAEQSRVEHTDHGPMSPAVKTPATQTQTHESDVESAGLPPTSPASSRSSSSPTQPKLSPLPAPRFAADAPGDAEHGGDPPVVDETKALTLTRESSNGYGAVRTPASTSPTKPKGFWASLLASIAGFFERFATAFKVIVVGPDAVARSRSPVEAV